MSNLSVLVIDNNKNRTQSLSMLLEFMEFKVTTQTELDAFNKEDHSIDLLIFGDRHNTNISQQLLKINQVCPQMPFVLLGKSDEIPFDSIQQQYPLCLGILEQPYKQGPFLELIHDLMDKPAKSTEPDAEANVTASTEMKDRDFLENTLIGKSPAIQMVRKLIAQVAKTNANVLILGESGTGKEVVANCIHNLSSRKTNAYVPVNCGAIPGDLLESELFGHEKGAFTGAISARKGRFELAQSGTLFLDEIGDMPLPMQVKILRVLQERIFERVGGNKSLNADVRVLAATHRNLEDQVEEGKFREDLFYRLNVFPIEIAPLKERVMDIPLLVGLLNQQMKVEKETSVNLSKQAMASLFMHPWPGNVRELGNLVERLGIMFPEELVTYEHLPIKYQHNIDDFDFQQLADYQEIEVIPSQNGESSELVSMDVMTTEVSNHIEDTEVQQEVEQGMTSEVIPEEKASITSSPAENVVPQSVPSQQDSIQDVLDDEEFDLKAHLSNLEQILIEEALEKSNGVVAHAAKRLNIRRTTLVEKMRKYEISGK